MTKWFVCPDLDKNYIKFYDYSRFSVKMAYFLNFPGSV